MSYHSLVERALTRCSGGHGFDSCRGLRFFSLSRVRVMLINSLFTFHYRAQNSPSSFTYHRTDSSHFLLLWDTHRLHLELFTSIQQTRNVSKTKFYTHPQAYEHCRT